MRDGMLALAALLGKPREELASALGEHWSQRVQGADSGVELFLSGEPAQVIIVVDQIADTLEVTRPAIAWDGQSPRLVPGAVHLQVDLSLDPSIDDISQAVREAADARRRSFRWCDCCRQLWPREYMEETELCQACAAHSGQE